MKSVAAAVLIVAAACGGSSKPPRPDGPATAVAPADEDTEDLARPAAPEPEPPPLPQHWQASAAMSPVKGSKVKPFTVVFAQTEGEGTLASSDAVAGLKPGAYHLVVHEGTECGKNAAAAGPVWEDLGAGIALVAPRGAAPALAQESTDFALTGAQTITGRTLVLHADKRGAPGKVLACGAIALDEATEEPAE